MHAVIAAPISRGLPLDVGIEQRLADDGERETRHLRGHVERLTPPPAVARPFSVRRHRRRVGHDPVAVERRLRQPPLAHVILALARQQPLPEEQLHAFQPAALGEVPLLGDQDLASGLGIRHQKAAHRPDGERDEITVPLGARREERQGVPGHRIHDLPRIAGLRA